MFNAKTISGTSLFNKVGQFLKVIVVNYFNMFNVVMLNFTSFKVKEEKLGIIINNWRLLRIDFQFKKIKDYRS